MILQAKSNAPKPNQRKKWRKSTIVVVSGPAPPPSQPENSEALGNQSNRTSEANASMNLPQNVLASRPENAALAPKAENNFTETDIPLKIPRAMRKATSSNFGKQDEPVEKNADAVHTRSPIPQRRKMTEKENHDR